ncbi:MAG TPA: hypothetical protein PLP27_08285 [Crocinitomicaceae bacterium]|nr:hypothetical protein [Crocinitomicaceae bacterium]
MATEDLFLQAIKTASKKGAGATVITGVAKNIKTDTCDVFRDGMPTLFDVSLTAKDSNASDYIKITKGKFDCCRGVGQRISNRGRYHCAKRN